MKHDRKDQNQYRLSDSELKVLRAVWLKNAPMSYEEILGACLSDYWHEYHARQDIDALIKKQLLEQLDTGRYDALLSYEEFTQMTEPPRERRKWPSLFRANREEAEYPPFATYYCFGPATEYELRYLKRMLEKRRLTLEQEKGRQPTGQEAKTE